MDSLNFDSLEELCHEQGLELADRDLGFISRFHEKLGHLRDKSKFSFNLDGEMDFQREDLIALASRARFSIGASITCQNAGLAQLWAPGIGGQYFPGRQDWLFYYFVDSSYANLYDAWARIANILSIFWPPATKQAKIYLPSTLEVIEKALFPAPDSLRRLLEFKETAYTQLLNKHRKEIVHTRSTQNSYFKRFLSRLSDESSMKELEDERDSKTAVLRDNYSRLLAGMDDMVGLIATGFPKR